MGIIVIFVTCLQMPSSAHEFSSFIDSVDIVLNTFKFCLKAFFAIADKFVNMVTLRIDKGKTLAYMLENWSLDVVLFNLRTFYTRLSNDKTKKNRMHSCKKIFFYHIHLTKVSSAISLLPDPMILNHIMR